MSHKNEELIDKMACRKLRTCIIVAISYKMDIYTIE
jgi:hypothetical protein